MRRRRRVAAALAVVAVAAAGGGWLATRSAPSTRTTPSPSTSPTSSGGVLRLLSENRYPSLDPSALVLPQARNLGRLLYRTLTTYDDDGRSLVPDLASAPGTASADHRTWTYALRGGQRYADGSVVVASDVVRGVRLSLARGALPAGLVRSVAAPDARTVVVRFGQPFVDADAILALTAAAPVPPRGVRASGPYEVSARTATSFRLVRNPHWSGPAPGPEEVDGELGLDGATIDQRLAAGAGGDAAAVTDKPALDVVPASRKHVVSGLDGSVLFAAMDMHRGPFSDLLVRQALEVAVPLDRVRAAAGSGTGEPATDLLPPPVPGHQDLDLYGWKARKDGGDPVRAKQLLADAGHPAGVTVTAAVPRSAAAVGEALRAGLAPAGFRVVVSAVPDAAYYATVGVAARQADLVLYAWSPDWLTGSAVIPPLFTCAALTATANHNVAQHCDPGFDRQVDIALGTPDDDAREAMWRALDRRLVEEALVVPRSFGVATALVGPAVKDAQPAVCFGGMVDLLRVRLGG